MNTDTKKIISVTAVILLAIIAIYGSYLPLRKSRLYISGSNDAKSVSTLLDFTNAISPSLDAASPIGQNELTRNVASMVLTIVQSAGENKELVAAAIEYINSYYAPIIARGTGGLSFSQDLYVLSLINETAFLRTQDVKYYQASLSYYEEGARRSPQRPQFLYGLFDMKRFAGDVAGVERIVNQILTYWPDDENIKVQYQKFLDKVASSTAVRT